MASRSQPRLLSTAIFHRFVFLSRSFSVICAHGLKIPTKTPLNGHLPSFRFPLPFLFSHLCSWPQDPNQDSSQRPSSIVSFSSPVPFQSSVLMASRSQPRLLSTAIFHRFVFLSRSF